MKNSPGLVIIGNSAAGTAAVAAIRAHDAEVPVTIVSREAGAAYSRPFIIHQHNKPETLGYRDAAFYKKHHVTLRHTAAEGIDAKNRQVRLSGGKKLAYRKLLLAVGGVPVKPPVPGLDHKRVFTLTTLADARALQQAVKPGMNGVVIGCGMIGIKAAEYLAELGVKVTIVELQDRPFAAVLDERGAALVTAQLKKHCTLVLGDSVARVTATHCVLHSGRELPAGVVVCAIGVVPDLALARTAKLKVGRGIIVDEKLRTSHRDIYAAGDCAEALDMLSGEKRPIPVWPLAFRQGAIAGANMAGARQVYAGGFLLNSVSVFGLPLITLGLSTLAAAEELARSDAKKGCYKKILLRDGRIVGAIFVGDIDRAGIITGLISDGIVVEQFKNDILNDQFGYIYVPQEFRSKEVAPSEI